MSISITVDGAAWQRQFKEGVRKTLQVADKIFKEAVQEFKKDVAHRTPIGHPAAWQKPPTHDYVPGALRRSWQIDWQGDSLAFVYNDRIYAYRVETGWSQQAPQGMMRLAVLDFPMIIAKLSAKYKI